MAFDLELGDLDYFIITQKAGINSLSTLTFSWWMNLEGFGGGSYGRIFEKVDDFKLFVNSIGKDDWLFEAARWATNDGQWSFDAGATSLAKNEWHHWAVTYDYSSVDNDPLFYMDGVNFATNEEHTPAGTLNSSTNDLHVGNRANEARNFDGKIDDLRIYNRVLSANEIKTIYACQGSDGIVHGLVFREVGRQKHAGQTITAVTDWSGIQNTGSVQNDPVAATNATRFKKKLA